MSRRAWRKLKDEKAKRKADRKAEIKRANAMATGPAVGPGGFEALEVRCPNCDYPTTQVLAAKSGATCCSRCMEATDSAMFAVVRELRGDEILTHVVSPA
jgi:protein-arginine kinase activator protein McsA